MVGGGPLVALQSRFSSSSCLFSGLVNRSHEPHTLDTDFNKSINKKTVITPGVAALEE